MTLGFLALCPVWGQSTQPKKDCRHTPDAEFSASVTMGLPPLLVSFEADASCPAETFLWDFGDGTFSFLEDPTYGYTLPGTYSVTLTVSNGVASDTVTKTDYIVVRGPTDATCTPYNGSDVNPNVFTCTSDPILGATWTSQVDNTTIGASGLFFVFVFEDALGSPLVLNVGELLLDVASPYAGLGFSLVGGPAATVSIPIPDEAALLGTTIHAQGYFNNAGGNGLLTNGLELLLGDF